MPGDSRQFRLRNSGRAFTSTEKKWPSLARSIRPFVLDTQELGCNFYSKIKLANKNCLKQVQYGGNKKMEKPLSRFEGPGLMQMTANVVSAYVANNILPASQLSDVIATVFSSLQSLGNGQIEPRPDAIRPAISIKKSITPDYLVCLEDGKKLKTLKRHLRTTYDMTPDDYRAKWGLPPDYPMVAPNYAAQRSAFAKQIGLGRGAAKRGPRAIKR